MATIVVLDDDARNLHKTRLLIEQEAPEDAARQILEASSLEQLSSIVSSVRHVDILVTDIMMGEGNPSGIDIVQRYFPPASGTQIVYMSGYLGQATEVYRTDHVYFLLKPIDPRKLHDALSKAYARLSAASPRMLHIVSDHRDRLVNPNSIRYLESNLHRVSVHCGPVVYDTYAKLDELQKQLSSDFSRCHRSYLVNLAFVSRLDENELHLHDGTTLPVSRRRARNVQRDLLAFLSKG